MAYTVMLHIAGEDPIVGEVEALPQAADTLVPVNNPRRKDGKDIHYLESNVTLVIWPLARINFIEVLPGEEQERIIGFVRE